MRVAAHTTTTQSPAPSPTGNGCPRGQTRGTGSLIDICIDFDSDPLFLGGGIKLGGLRGPSSSNPTPSPTNKDRSGSGTRPSSSSPSASPTSSRCSDGTTYDAFLDICIDIDTDPLFLGGGIKIGGSPQRPSSTSSSPSRNGSPTSRPSSDRGEQQGSPPRRTNGQDDEGDLPDCDGPNDPRAFVDLCVNAGNLLGVSLFSIRIYSCIDSELTISFCIWNRLESNLADPVLLHLLPLLPQFDHRNPTQTGTRTRTETIRLATVTEARTTTNERTNLATLDLLATVPKIPMLPLISVYK